MNKSILVTGGTGSFGKAFTKLLLEKSDYDRIVIYSRDEHKQERMAEEFKSDRLRFFIGDIRDKERLRLALQDCIHIVHAAALKVVPAGEYDPIEFIKTNIIGAQNLVEVMLDSYRQYGRVIALSTDKAVNPVNLYGATKLCMEKLFIASNNLAGARDIKFSICRYGNVANSTGSVIQKFKEQCKNKEPLTITDAKMTRFWITLEEAAEFVYNIISHKIEKGKVYIPNMPSFNIMDLASAFQSGDLHYKTIGVRPGEKIHEQIDENRFSNGNERFLSWQELRKKLEDLNVIN